MEIDQKSLIMISQ